MAQKTGSRSGFGEYFGLKSTPSSGGSKYNRARSYQDYKAVRSLNYLSDSRNLDTIFSSGFPTGEKTLRVSLENSKPYTLNTDQNFASNFFGMFRRRR